MRGTGLLEVSARALPGESAVEALFRDHGTGIDKAHLDKIFDPYFTTKEKGHGLGLATSFLIIKRHGGTIQVASEVGVGSTFTVRLPVGAAKTASAAPKAPAPLRASYRILVMEDDALIRKLIGKLLEARGHRTVFAVDGDEAIARYREGMASPVPFDLVIMDLTIPGGMGGKEAIGHLRTLDPNVRAIVSSGYCDDPILSDYRGYGFQAVLGKPYSLEELVSTLNKVMAGRAAEVGNAS
jgi:CheY-like chemotaxis protein